MKPMPSSHFQKEEEARVRKEAERVRQEREKHFQREEHKHYCGDQHKLQAKLLPTVPQKVAGQAASRVGLPVAKG